MTRVSVVSWNVHACRGADGATRPERVAAVLGELRPGIAVLQEVLSDRRPGPPDQARFLADATGRTAVEGVTLERAGARYGNLVLSAYPILEVARHDVSVPGREPRGVIEAVLDVGWPLRVLATHLGLAARERRLQAERLSALVAGRRTPTLVCGDLNEALPFGPVSRRLARAGVRAPLRRTFPASWPLLPLDRIGVAHGLRLGSLAACGGPAARRASDHRPLCAELVLPPREPRTS